MGLRSLVDFSGFDVMDEAAGICVDLEPDWLIAAGTYPGFCRMRRLGIFLLPLDGMLVHRRSLPRNLLAFPNNSPVPIYIPGWREAL